MTAAINIETAKARRESLALRFIKRPAGAVSLSILLLVVLVGLLAPWLSPYDPNFVNLKLTKAPPGTDHWLGGDSSGRDVLSRLIWGTQTTLYGALVAVATGVVAGVPAGVAAGDIGRTTHRISTRISDALQAKPGKIKIGRAAGRERGL